MGTGKPCDCCKVNKPSNCHHPADPRLLSVIRHHFLRLPIEGHQDKEENFSTQQLQGQIGQVPIIDALLRLWSAAISCRHKVHTTVFYLPNREKEEGFFVEAGALDGVYLSNTLFFEKKRKVHVHTSSIRVILNHTLFHPLKVVRTASGGVSRPLQKTWSKVLIAIQHKKSYANAIFPSTRDRSFLSPACLSPSRRASVQEFDHVGLINRGAASQLSTLEFF